MLDCIVNRFQKKRKEIGSSCLVFYEKGEPLLIESKGICLDQVIFEMVHATALLHRMIMQNRLKMMKVLVTTCDQMR